MISRILAVFFFMALGFYSCKDRSCPENCIQFTGFVKDTFTSAPAAGLPYEVYWVKHKTVTKDELIDTGMTDQQGRINKTIQIDRDKFETHWIFFRLLPSGKFMQIKGTYVTEAIEEYTPSKHFNFTVLEEPPKQSP